MPGQLFLTGMMRSGTSLAQILLTNHAQLFVAPQPFYQFYLDVKQSFLKEQGKQTILPLGDGMDSGEAENVLFRQWLHNRQFDAAETAQLVARSTTAKSGGAADLTGKLTVEPGNFFDIREALHYLLARHFEAETSSLIGSKDAFCEEYIPALIDKGVRCVMIIRDPRAVIASANHGRYFDTVGNRYPLLMLIRLWRKSAAYWYAYRNEPLVKAIRYEDLIQYPVDTLREVARWLDVSPFPEGLIHQPLRDHAGKFWRGNSSFGDKSKVDVSSKEAWQNILSQDAIRFIEACTKPELTLLGYSLSTNPERNAIADFIDDVSGVRESYLSLYALSQENRKIELRRWDAAETGRYVFTNNERLFLFPEIYSDVNIHRG